MKLARQGLPHAVHREKLDAVGGAAELQGGAVALLLAGHNVKTLHRAWMIHIIHHPETIVTASGTDDITHVGGIHRDFRFAVLYERHHVLGKSAAKITEPLPAHFVGLRRIRGRKDSRGRAGIAHHIHLLKPGGGRHIYSYGRTRRVHPLEGQIGSSHPPQSKHEHQRTKPPAVYHQFV